jgi:hypothetical protein
MYDFIRFEVDAYKYKDLDKRFSAAYSGYTTLDDMAIWSDCGCHWFISVPVTEEYHLREWFLDSGIQVTGYEYTKRRTVEDQKEWLVGYLTGKIDEIKNYLQNPKNDNLTEPFNNGARYKLIYYDMDDIENFYHSHNRPLDLYHEAIEILELAIKEIEKYPRFMTSVSCALSGFYVGVGSKINLMDLMVQTKKEIRLFDIQIGDNSIIWYARLVAVRQDTDNETKQNKI